MSPDRMFPRLSLSALALLIATIGPAAAQGIKLGEPAEAPGTVDLGAAQSQAAPAGGGGDVKRTTHGDWEVACMPNGDSCAMAQIGQDGEGNPVLEMVIRKLREPLEIDGETAVAVLDVITPLGVVLIDGLSMQIDGGQRAAAPFQVCTEQGCLVREPVDNQLISRLKRGNIANITVVAANQGEVSSKVSLTGFTAAYDSL